MDFPKGKNHTLFTFKNPKKLFLQYRAAFSAIVIVCLHFPSLVKRIIVKIFTELLKKYKYKEIVQLFLTETVQLK
jgi:hypothetical protein